MRVEALKYLIDPTTKSFFEIHAYEYNETQNEIKTGILKCIDNDNWLPIHKYNPRIVGTELFNTDEEVFKNKSPFTKKELSNPVCLDAGCGNGRYSYWAAKSGAKIVISVDISSKVIESCYSNTLGLNVIPIQASINNLPFQQDSSDFVYSIGVLQYMYNSRVALINLLRVTKITGCCSIHVFQR